MQGCKVVHGAHCLAAGVGHFSGFTMLPAAVLLHYAFYEQLVVASASNVPVNKAFS